MIPNFPEFKNLELSDQEEIENIASKYQPYSDFNFANLWAWNFNNATEISLFHNNLIIRFIDHIKGNQVYSYLGNSHVTETVTGLFTHLNEIGLSDVPISVVPEVSLTRLDFTHFFIEIDINTCDYIYDLKSLSNLSGNKYTQKRGRVNNFKQKYPNTEVKELDLNSLEIADSIKTLNSLWLKNKPDENNGADRELDAIERFIDSKLKNTFSLGAFIDGNLVGYAIYSYHRDDYVINHFIKADFEYKGIYEFLIQQSAAILSEKKYKYLNYQEDMGMPGLRQAKLSYRPIGYLRKYFIRKL